MDNWTFASDGCVYSNSQKIDHGLSSFFHIIDEIISLIYISLSKNSVIIVRYIDSEINDGNRKRKFCTKHL